MQTITIRSKLENLLSQIDDDDYHMVSGTVWYLSSDGYARSSRGVTMHRLIMGFPKGIVDHINQNKLDNRRANLRVATKSQNNANSKPRGGASRFKGVYPAKHGVNKWEARIRKDGKLRYLGQFSSQEEAAKAYDEAAIRLYGEYAGLNYDYAA